MGSVTTRVIIDILESHFSHWGLPKAITTDNGPQMVSNELSSYLEGEGTRHIRTAYYQPQGNTRCSKMALGHTSHKGACICSKHCCTAMQQSTTAVSPASLMLGRELQLPLERLRPFCPPLAQPPVHNAWATVVAHQQWMKNHFDKTRWVRPPVIAASDWVRIRWPNLINKLQSFWSNPVQERRQLVPVTFHLSDSSR